MPLSDKFITSLSAINPLLCASIGLSASLLLSSCGGGGGGAGSGGQAAETPPAQLGAALPDDGDFIAITQEAISLPESGRVGHFVVSRRGSAQGESSVQYRFMAESASAETDFRGVDGMLNWADGETGDRRISFRVESDVVPESEETFRVELFDATGSDSIDFNNSVKVTITDSACSATVPASMTASTELSAPCYQLNGEATFGPSGQLSIPSGTTIISSADSSITLTGTSTLSVEGSPSLPVILKGANDNAGMWKGVALQSNSALHRISHAEISGAFNAVNLRAGAFALFNNNLLSNNSGAGVVLPMTDVETLGTENTFVNTARGIEVVGRNIEEGQMVNLPAQSTHYVLSNGLIISGTLALEAGTDLRMGADAPVLVLGNGVISALGTAEQPINISGVLPQQGYWNGIQYVSTINPANRLEHVTVADGGGDPARAGNIIVDGLDTQISMQHCALNNSAGYGLVYDSLSFQVELTDVTFAANRLGEQSL